MNTFAKRTKHKGYIILIIFFNRKPKSQYKKGKGFKVLINQKYIYQ